MRRRPVRHAAAGAARFVEPRQRVQQARHALRRPAVRRDVADAELIGLELGAAAVLEEQQTQRDARRLSERLRLGHENPEHGESAAGECLVRCGFRGVTRVDMADLVAEHGRHLRFVAEERHDAARQIDVAAGQRERVDRGFVHDGERPRQVGPFRRLRELAPDAFDVALQRRVLIDAHRLADFGVVLPAELDLLGFRHENQLAPPCGRIRRAGDEQGNSNSYHQAFHHTLPLDRWGAMTSLSAWATRDAFSSVAPVPIRPTRQMRPASGPRPPPISI